MTPPDSTLIMPPDSSLCTLIRDTLPFSADVFAKLSEIVVPDRREPLDCESLEKTLKEKQRQVSHCFQTYLTSDDDS